MVQAEAVAGLLSTFHGTDREWGRLKTCRDIRPSVAIGGKPDISRATHFGSECRVGPGNFTPSLSQIRT